MKGFLNVLRIIGIITFSIFAISYAILTIATGNLYFLIALGVFGLFDLLCIIKKPKQRQENKPHTELKTEVNDDFKVETPPEILSDMKKYYPTEDIPSLLRILDDCQKIVLTSKNIKTVVDRLEFACVKTCTLKQLEQCGLYHQKPSANEFANLFFTQKNNIICKAIERNYIDELNKASQLKTQTARENRIARFFQGLQEYDFNETITEYIEKLKKTCQVQNT